MFSIIIPVYNRENSISKAIDSVLKQSYEHWELILIDDGSKDRTKEVCQRYANKDTRVRYFYKENGGVCTARNMGLDKAQGTYILFLDSDDIFVENAFSAIADGVAKYPQAEMVCFGYVSGENTWIPIIDGDQPFLNKEQIHKLILPTHINIYSQEKNFLANFVWNKCYRQDFLQKNKIRFDENRKTWEDGLFVVNCLDNAESISVMPEALHLGCNVQVDHLSSRFFENQILNYVEDEKYFKRRFEKELDFSSEHYCRSNFDVLNMLLFRELQFYRRKAKRVVRIVAEESIVSFWVSRIVPDGMFEKKVRKYVLKKKGVQVYYLYLLHHTITKMLRR